MENLLMNWLGGLYLHAEVYKGYLIAISEEGGDLHYLAIKPVDLECSTVKPVKASKNTLETATSEAREAVKQEYLEGIKLISEDKIEDTDDLLLSQMKNVLILGATP